MNFGSWPSSTVGTIDDKDVRINRGLLKFDVSALPPGQPVTRATLRLFIDSADPDPPNLAIVVERLAGDFVEGNGAIGVTWNTQPGFAGPPTATATMSTPLGVWFEMDATQLVRAVLGGGNPNEVLLGIRPSNETLEEIILFRFRTKEFDSGAFRPQLVITTATALPLLSPQMTAAALLALLVITGLALQRLRSGSDRQSPGLRGNPRGTVNWTTV